MSDVLTKEEREFVDRATRHMEGTVARACHINARLVAEVDRLRARNKALEKVAKSVALVAHFGGLIGLSTDGALNMVRRLTIEHFDKSSTHEELRVALSALNPSETPNSSGGET